MSVPLANPRRIMLFVSYSHQNRIWMKRLRPLLDGFQHDDRLTGTCSKLDSVHAWHDNELSIGNQWDGEIQAKLDRMDIFVPLISAEFFSSWYIQNVELKRAKERHQSDSVLIVPILLYDVNLREKSRFLHQFPCVPTSDRWWSRFKDKCDALRLIDDALWNAIKQVQARQLPGPA